jgi:hypothetical protein
MGSRMMTRDEKINFLTEVIETCEKRLKELEEAIRTTKNMGSKLLMQSSYDFNKEALRKCGDALKKVMNEKG